MKVLLLTLSLSIGIYLGGTSQGLDCVKFKTGKFVLKDPVAGTSYISRNDHFQIETAEGGKKTIKLKIKWLDDCTYVLTPTGKSNDLPPGFPPDAILTVHIIQTTGNTYTIRATLNFAEGEYVHEIEKIK